MMRQVYALLGRKDEPTDAVEEYCRYLGAALKADEIDLQIRRVPWEIHGWREALRGLRLQAIDWRDSWIFVQYTALGWSLRGFPFRFLRVLRMLKSAGAHVGIVFHDAEPYSSPRLVDRFRERAQRRVMRASLALAERAVFTVPLDHVSWFAKAPDAATFIPVGANLPFPETPVQRTKRAVLTIGVFSITGGERGARETQIILDAVKYATRKIGALRLSVFGRHAEIREAALRAGLREFQVDVSVEGVVSSELVVDRFASCDLLLFVRGGISSRRSSAIAGIAAGLPVIAYANAETAPPITEAGVLLTDPQHPQQLGEALVRILTDQALREQLAGRSRAAYQSYFSWSSIAAEYRKLLGVP